MKIIFAALSAHGTGASGKPVLCAVFFIENGEKYTTMYCIVLKYCLYLRHEGKCLAKTMLPKMKSL